MNYLLLRDSIELPPNELSPKKATLKEVAFCVKEALQST